MKPMSIVQQRILAVLLLLALIAIAVAGIGIPLIKQHKRYDARIEELIDRTSRFQRVAGQKTQLTETLTALRSKDVGRFTLKNSAANLAGAELQEAVRAAVEVNGARINAIQVANPREESGHRVYVVSTSFNATTTQLQKILHNMEAREPYVFVDALTVRSMVGRGMKPLGEPQVLVSIEASAFAPMPPIRTATGDKKPPKPGEKA